MADTIVNTPPQSPSDSGNAGWAVAVIILLLVIAGGFVWYRTYHTAAPAPAGDTTNINVTTPPADSEPVLP